MTLVSLMCHPEREPAVAISGDCFVNKEKGYGNAVRFAIRKALEERKDLVLADTDGYHPAAEIERLAALPCSWALVKPFREDIGFQSKVYSALYSYAKGQRVRDATGGLYRMSYSLMNSLPILTAEDMTINIEILNHAVERKVSFLQYGYLPGKNDRAGSKRTQHYQMKLLRAIR